MLCIMLLDPHHQPRFLKKPRDPAEWQMNNKKKKTKNNIKTVPKDSIV